MLLTDKAYDDKGSRSALCGVLRLLTGGVALPRTIVGEPTELEWWHDRAVAPFEGSLLASKMRTFEGMGGVQKHDNEILRSERLDFVVEKLFNRKATGRTQRLPRLLENGDVLVYIVGQVAPHPIPPHPIPPHPIPSHPVPSSCTSWGRWRSTRSRSA